MEKLSIEQILKTFPDVILIDDFLEKILNKVTYTEFVSEIIQYPYIYEKMIDKQDFWRKFITKTFDYSSDEERENKMNWFNEFLEYSEPIKSYYLSSTIPSALTKLIPDFVFSPSVLTVNPQNILPFNNMKDVKITARNYVPEYYVLLDNGDVYRIYQVNINSYDNDIENDINHNNDVDFTSKIEKFATNVKQIEIILYSETVSNNKIINYYIIVLLMNDNKIQFLNDSTDPYIEQKLQIADSDYFRRLKNSYPAMPDIEYDSIQLVCNFIENQYTNYPNEKFFSAKTGNTLYLMEYHQTLFYFKYQSMIYSKEGQIISYKIIKNEYKQLTVFIINDQGKLSMFKKQYENDRLEDIALNQLFTDNVIPHYLTRDLKSVEAFREEFGKHIYVVFKTNKNRAYLFLFENNMLYNKNDPEIAAVEFFIPRNKSVISVVAFDSYGKIYYVRDVSKHNNDVNYALTILSRNMFNKVFMPREEYHYGIIYEKFARGERVIYPYAMFLLQKINKQTYDEIIDDKFIRFRLKNSSYLYYTIRI
jgi:hypothetical protein